VLESQDPYLLSPRSYEEAPISRGPSCALLFPRRAMPFLLPSEGPASRCPKNEPMAPARTRLYPLSNLGVSEIPDFKISNIVASHDVHAEPSHLLDCALRVFRMCIDSTTAVFDHYGFEPQRPGVKRRVLYAIVRRQPHQIDPLDAAREQEVAQARGLAVGIVVEAALAVDARIGALLEDPPDAQRIQLLNQLSPARPLHAMHRP
jgi:hypothetical protein